jgi:hypothetical protein
MNRGHHEPCMPVHPANLLAQNDIFAPLRRTDRALDHAAAREEAAWPLDVIAPAAPLESRPQHAGGVWSVLLAVTRRIVRSRPRAHGKPLPGEQASIGVTQ